MFYPIISVDVFYDFWTSNAVTNKGQDPGPPRPIVAYEDRMGSAKDMPLIKWRNEDGYECWGTSVSHEQRTNASLRETTQDVAAREIGDQKEFERRAKEVLNQHKKAWNFGADVEIPGHKATSVRKESSDSTKVRKDHSLKKGETKERQDGQPKSRDPPARRVRTPTGSTRGADPSSSEDEDGKKKPKDSKVDLSTSASSQGSKKSQVIPPTGPQERRPLSRQPPPKRLAIYDEIATDIFFSEETNSKADLNQCA